jgi:hypothetical protein
MGPGSKVVCGAGPSTGGGPVAACFFFLPLLVTVVHMSPKGFPVRAGKSVGSGTGMSDRGWRVGRGKGGAGALMVIISSSKKRTLLGGFDIADIEVWVGRVVRKSLMKTNSESGMGRDFL